MFGVQYGEPLEKQKVGFSSIPDFIFPTLDGFLDILEIKKPDLNALIEDTSHSDSYSWSSDVSRAIGQVINYLHEIELHQLEIAKKINSEHRESINKTISVIKPRAFILIGKSEKWSEKKFEAFKKLNYALHGIEVITYNDLLLRGENLISLYTRNLK